MRQGLMNCSGAELRLPHVRRPWAAKEPKTAVLGCVWPEVLSGRIHRAQVADSSCNPDCCGSSLMPEIVGEDHLPNWGQVVGVEAAHHPRHPLDAFCLAAHRRVSNRLSARAGPVVGNSPRCLAEERIPEQVAEVASPEAVVDRKLRRVVCREEYHLEEQIPERRRSS